MKKNPDKQTGAVTIKQKIDPNEIIKYPKVHNNAHPNDFKIPIADLLNPDCPISAGVTPELRAELLKLKAKRAQYYYVADPVIVLDTSRPENKAIYDNVLRENLIRLQEDESTRKKDNETICDVDTALDINNPVSNILIDAEVRRAIEVIKQIGEGVRNYLDPAEANDVTSFFFTHIDTVLRIVNDKLIEKGLDPHNVPLYEVVNSEFFIEALKAAGYKSEQKPALPQVPIAKPERIYLPVDVVNNNIWGRLEKLSKPNKKGQMPGQLSFDIAEPLKHFEFNYINAAKSEKQPAYIILGTDFEKLESNAAAKHLTEYDKLVYQATGALWRYCVEELKSDPDKVIITAGLIYWAMGNNGTPGASDIQKINDTITKLRRAEFYLNNVYEVQEHKNQAKFRYDGAFLPSERISAIVNNVVVDSAIHLFREPPLLSFARERGQITTIDRRLLAEMPLDKSERSIGLFHYLITQIAFIKNPKNKMANPKILYATIFEKLNIDGKTEADKKARQRTKKNAQRLLEFFTHEGVIDGYIEKELQGGQGVEIIINMPKITQDKSNPTEQ